MNKNDVLKLYNDCVCALTHDLSVCEDCKKCGDNRGAIRLDLIKRLSDVFTEKYGDGFDLPWADEEDQPQEYEQIPLFDLDPEIFPDLERFN